MTYLHLNTRRKNMKRISYTAMVAMVNLAFLVGCDGDSGFVAAPPPPPPVPAPTVLVWDQGLWDEVVWE